MSLASEEFQKDVELGTLKKVNLRTKGRVWGLSRARKTKRKRDWHPIIEGTVDSLLYNTF